MHNCYTSCTGKWRGVKAVRCRVFSTMHCTQYWLDKWIEFLKTLDSADRQFSLKFAPSCVWFVCARTPIGDDEAKFWAVVVFSSLICYTTSGVLDLRILTSHSVYTSLMCSWYDDIDDDKIDNNGSWHMATYDIIIDWPRERIQSCQGKNSAIWYSDSHLLHTWRAPRIKWIHRP